MPNQESQQEGPEGCVRLCFVEKEIASPGACSDDVSTELCEMWGDQLLPHWKNVIIFGLFPAAEGSVKCQRVRSVGLAIAGTSVRPCVCVRKPGHVY